MQDSQPAFTTLQPPAKPDFATHDQRLKRIGLMPFVAVLYAYCAGGPFGFEAMVSTSGPGLALTFMLRMASHES